MPIENEHKFVLKNHEELFQQLNQHHKQHLLDQFYLNENARFRRVEIEGREAVERCFTYKQMIDGKLLEIERLVSEADYLLAAGSAVSSLSKVRFKLLGAEPDTIWDIDFLLTHSGGDIYFALAEVEFPIGATYAVPQEIAPFIALAVPPESSHLFTNKRLSNQSYARMVLNNYPGELSHGR